MFYHHPGWLALGFQPSTVPPRSFRRNKLALDEYEEILAYGQRNPEDLSFREVGQAAAWWGAMNRAGGIDQIPPS